MMLEPKEFKGFWWLPEIPKKQLPGILTFSQDEGAILELVGVFGTKRKFLEQPPIILGIAQNGKPITLYDCQVRQWTFPVTGLGGATYRAQVIFEGAHFQKEEEIKFCKLCGGYTDLDAWVDISGFRITYDLSEKNYRSTIKYSRPKSRHAIIGDNYEVGIGFTFKGPDQEIVQTEAKISQHAYLFVSNKIGDQPFEGIFDLLNNFSYLFQIGTQRIVYPTEIMGFTTVNKKERNNGQVDFPQVNIYYEPIESYVVRKSLIPQDMLFTFKDLTHGQIKRWFKDFERYKTVINLHRSLFYNNRLFIENRFLNIAQALESLHSILFSNESLPHDEFIKRKEKALLTVPEDLKGWVGGAINSANYKHFQDKLLELLEKKRNIIGPYIGDIVLFAQRVKDTRNEFVHHNKQKKSFQEPQELFNAIETMRMVFEIYVLDIIGFPEEKVQELLEPRIKSLKTGWHHLRTKKN